MGPSAGKNGIYHLTPDLVNDAIHWVEQHDAVSPQKPFFLYLATGASHSLHHVPPEWVAKQKGLFDQGWTNSASTLRPTEGNRRDSRERGTDSGTAAIPAWDSLTEPQKKLLSHQMEV